METTTYHTQFNPVDGFGHVQYDPHPEHASHRINFSENLHADDGSDHFHLEFLTRIEADLEEAAPNPPTLQRSG